LSSANVVNTSVVPVASTLHPYYDDYSEASNFYRILYRPGQAVQARELTQMQTMAQVQIERFGRHVFSEGSIVIGGQLSYDSAISLNLASQYIGTDVDVTDFIGRKVTNYSNTTNVQAQVITAANATDTEPPVLLIKYLTGDEFNASDTIRVSGANTFANVASANISSNGSTASISDGIFFIKGFFVRGSRQTVLLSKYTKTANVKLGLEYTDEIVDENDDASLNDLATEASSFQAPGATRYKIDLTLATRTYTSIDDEQFIELSRFANGRLTNEVNIPVYSELEETFARRTYDESGSYTVRPFKLELKDDPDNTANVIAKIEPGKAYVFGYEFQTIAPEEISIERPRDTDAVSLYDISTAYGNYISVNGVKGFVDISTQPLADIHCVPSNFANNLSATTYNATKIGTTRIRNLMYSTSSNTANGMLHEVNAYIFDARISAITGTANSGTTNTITIASPQISSNDNAYTGATIRLTGGTNSGDSRTISAYNGANKIVTVSPNFSVAPDSTTTFSLDFAFKDAESFIIGTAGGALTANLNVALSSKDDGTVTGNAVVSEPTFSSLVFPFPDQFIKTGATINNYQYRKVFSGRSFTAGVGTVTVAAGEALVGTGTLSDTIKRDNYIVVVNNPDTSGLVRGQILSFDTSRGASISVAGSTATLTANNAGDFTADIITTVEINSGSETNPKAKTLISANTTLFGVTANASFFNSAGANTAVYLAEGQVLIQSPNKVPGTADSLYISDVKTLQKVYDLNGAAVPAGAASITGYSDVTSKFRLDNGQRDTHYDHASIILKSGVSAPKGPLIVCVDYYNHSAGTSDGNGYFNVDSYPDADTTAGYAAIPYYTDNRGYKYKLSDVVDFRPKRQNSSNTSPGYTLQGIRIPSPNEEFTVTYDHYLPRKDLIVLTKSRQFSHIEGVSAQLAYPPNDPQDAMVLYRLDLPPYVMSPDNVVVKYVENKRYTMRDIGKLEQRIQNMEYYTALNFLEKAANDIVIRDVNGLERTKYGIVADNFVGHQIGDITNPDYRCSMDFNKGEMRPFFKTSSHALKLAGGDANYRLNGTTITLDYSEGEFITQNTASRAENIQPYFIAKFIGNVELIPDNDVWVDTDRKPDVVANLSGANDAWAQLAALINADHFGTEWSTWQTHWAGTTQSTQVTTSPSQIVTTTTTVQSGTQTREGSATQLNFDQIQQSLGDRVVDVSIVPYIRARDVFFVGHNLRPTRRVFYFFDETAITDYVSRPDVIKLTSNTRFIDADGYNERISIGSNTAQVLLTRRDTDGNTLLYVANVIGQFLTGVTITGAVSGNTATVNELYHYAGTSNVAAASTSTINLAMRASSTANVYHGNTISLVAGLGAGQNSTIISYNATTRVATVSPAFNVTPAANTRYSIGNHKTTTEGAIAGTYSIPSNDTLSFRTGERIFRVTDEDSNDLVNLTTRADARYVAEGLIQQKENLSVAVTVPRIATTVITQTRPVTTSSMSQSVVNIPQPDDGGSNESGDAGGDPLAQTFMVSARQYPYGVFISSVDLFFKSKDNVLPVWVEIRPTVNGYPHSSLILPFSSKTIYPIDVKVSDTPSSANTSTATTFEFSNPVYLEAGQEYALVVRTNSLDYEAYIAEMGKKIIGSDRIISTQPAVGSLFKSQNASTWTPFQFEDLMFVLKKCVFTTDSSAIYLNNSLPAANSAMDWMYLQTNALDFNQTSLAYAFKATAYSGFTADSGFTSFNSDGNYRHNERKVVHTLTEGSLNVRAVLSTTSVDVSPMLDVSRYNVIAIENMINNANLSNVNIVLTNDGAGYTAANATITISDGDASTTANAYVGSVSGGNITSIIVDTAGSYYTETANIVFSGGGATTNATAIIASELRASGGPAMSKYITRKVVLNEGYDAGDLRVFLTAYKPLGTELVVYYKVRNSDDPETFENKPYQKMVQITPSNRYSKTQSSESDLIEFEYRPSATGNSISYVSSNVTFSTFNEFAIKIVPLSDSTITVPVVKNMRSIALPSSD